MERRIAYTLALLTTLSLGLSSDAAASTIYSATPIDLPAGWSFSSVRGVNDQGQVVGYGEYNYSGTPRGLMWDRRTRTTYVLPDLPGGKDESYAYGINNSGQVAGYSSETWAVTWSASAAVIWTPTTGQIRVLDHAVVSNPNMTKHNEYGMAINASGLVAGQALSSAALWDTGGHLQDLGGLTIPNIGSYAYDLNDHNDVTGNAYIPVGTSGVWAHAFLWDGGTGNMYDLGVLPIAGHEQSFGRAINNAGNVVGFSIKADCQARAFYKSLAGSMVSISASLPAGVISRLIWNFANDINDSNQVVGECLLKQFQASDEQQQAFVWGPTSGGQMLSDMLDSSGHGMAVRAANAINNRGEIVVQTQLLGQSGWGGYILTPHELDSDPLPQGTGVGANLLGGSGGSQPGGLNLTFDSVSAGGTLSAVYRQTDATSFANGYLNSPSDIDFVLSGLPGGNVQFWEVALAGGAFDKATLTVHYDDSLLPVGFDETTLGISHYHDGVWEDLSVAARDTFANTITFETTGFSSFVLTPEPATLSLLALGGLAALARRASAPLLRLR